MYGNWTFWRGQEKVSKSFFMNKYFLGNELTAVECSYGVSPEWGSINEGIHKWIIGGWFGVDPRTTQDAVPGAQDPGPTRPRFISAVLRKNTVWTFQCCQITSHNIRIFPEINSPFPPNISKKIICLFYSVSLKISKENIRKIRWKCVIYRGKFGNIRFLLRCFPAADLKPDQATKLYRRRPGRWNKRNYRSQNYANPRAFGIKSVTLEQVV